MQDQKKDEKVIKKPGKFVPQEVKVPELDDISAEIEALVTKTSSERMYEQMYAPPYREMRRTCPFGCSCEPCLAGYCGECSYDRQRNGGPSYMPYQPYK